MISFLLFYVFLNYYIITLINIDFLNYRLPQTKQKRNPNAVSTSGSGPSPIKVTKLNTDARPLTADEYRKYGSLVNKLRHGK